MLQVITGKAGTGKTALLMQMIADEMNKGKRSILVVPEQYSHQAERELCGLCGSKVSLYAEVLTFTGLARWVDRQLGSGEPVTLDKGGQLLCMALAVDMVYSQLRVYGGARKRAAMQNQLLDAVTELKTACISQEELLRAAGDCDGLLGDKLHDLALVYGAYDVVVSGGRADPTDKLTRLAERIGDANMGDIRIFVDGFTDFTGQQLRVLESLLESGCEITVCLTCDVEQYANEVYAISRSTLHRLERIAENYNAQWKVIEKKASREETALEFFCDRMFTYSRDRMEDTENRIRLFAGESVAEECEFAAAQAISFVRDHGCRWRDIAIAVRGFEGYETLLDSAFRKYGVPLYMTKKTPLIAKPLAQMIEAAYEIVMGGWDAEDMFVYLRTGLTGMEAADCDVLENYVLLWDLRGNAWTKETDWSLHPRGYEKEKTPEDYAVLRRVNVLRRSVATPLAAFAEATKAANTGHEQVMALVQLLETVGADGVLAERALRLTEVGYPQQAAECEKIWEMTLCALEQFDSILGDTEMDTNRFAQLLLLMLSKYDVGTIPIAVDRVSAGEMDRMRRRNLKHLIVLGATDGNLPRPEERIGVFSEDDRSRLMEVGLELGTCGDAELWREFGLIYNCLTLPKETLTLTYPVSGENRPSMVMSRAKALFDKEIRSIDVLETKTASYDSALELAAFSLYGNGEEKSASAAAYFRETEPERLGGLQTAANQLRGRLSSEGVRNLYGNKLKLSASRIDRFNSCPFSYYMEYGLKAKPRTVASFAPPEMGDFMHYVLEKVAQEIMEKGGFATITDAEVHGLMRKYFDEYVDKVLNKFQDKTPRFKYLFERLFDNMEKVVNDMVSELRKSQFEPVAFELNFGDPEKVPPMEIGSGEASMTLTGIADRVDAWVHDGKVYLRVVDYKTGKKEFKLSDIWHGMNLQMLLYLFTLAKLGPQKTELEVVPAGVLYIPASHKHVVGTENLSDEDILKEQKKAHKRSGLILEDDEVIHAMEQGGVYEYLPVKLDRKGNRTSDSLATAAQLDVLSDYVDQTLQKLAASLKGGNIAASPYRKKDKSAACDYCKYAEVCCFEDGQRGEYARYMPNLSAEKVWEMMENCEEGGEVDG